MFAAASYTYRSNYNAEKYSSLPVRCFRQMSNMFDFDSDSQHGLEIKFKWKLHHLQYEYADVQSKET